VKVDENVFFTKCGNLRFVVEFEALEAVFACDAPLLGRCRCHDKKLKGL